MRARIPIEYINPVTEYFVFEEPRKPAIKTEDGEDGNAPE